MSDDATDSIVQSLVQRIESFEQLDVYLTVASEPDRAWSLPELVARSRRAPDEIDGALSAMRAAGLLRPLPDGRWRLDAAPGARVAAAALLDAWREDPSPIVRVLSDNAIARVRSEAAHRFASAFVLRRKKSDG